MLNISLRSLQAIDTLSTYKTIAKASEVLNLSPTALSYQIKQVESQLEVKLFKKQGKILVATKAGHFFIGEIRSLLDYFDTMTQKTRFLDDNYVPAISICINSVLNQSSVLSLCDRSKKLFPKTQIHIFSAFGDNMWRGLNNHEYDLIIGSIGLGPKSDKIQSYLIGSCRWIFCVSSFHPLLYIKDLSFNNLKEYVGIYVKSQLNTIRLMYDISDGTYVSDFKSQLELVLMGHGYGVFIEGCVQEYLQRGMLIKLPINCSDDRLQLSLAYNTTIKPSSVLKWWIKQTQHESILNNLLSKSSI